MFRFVHHRMIKISMHIHFYDFTVLLVYYKYFPIFQGLRVYSDAIKPGCGDTDTELASADRIFGLICDRDLTNSTICVGKLPG